MADLTSPTAPGKNNESWIDRGGGLFARLAAVAIQAGTALIGTVGIDQTTPGTTDSVTVATAQGAGAAIGATTGAAVNGDANQTIQQALRSLNKYIYNVWGGSAAAWLGVRLQTGNNVEAGTVTQPLKIESGYTLGRATADAQIKGSAGFIHTVSIAPLTATPTAGLLTVYDSLTETGTVLYSEWIFATTPGHTVKLDVSFATGLYVGFDAALASVQVTVSYR